MEGQANERKQFMKHRHITFTTILLALGSFALFPIVQAVTPAPDGGYPGFNTAEGQSALLNLTTGVGNTAVGWFSLWSNTDGSFNTGVGAGTLLFNVGDQIQVRELKTPPLARWHSSATLPEPSTRPMERSRSITIRRATLTRRMELMHSK